MADAFRNSRVSISIPGAHCRAKTIFSLCIPVSALEFQEHGRIRNSHVGLDEEHSKDCSNLIKPGDDLFVRQRANFSIPKEKTQLLPIGSNPGCVALRDK